MPEPMVRMSAGCAAIRCGRTTRVSSVVKRALMSRNWRISSDEREASGVNDDFVESGPPTLLMRMRRLMSERVAAPASRAVVSEADLSASRTRMRI